jgi:nucleotide-binding universal stress UspA family protein
MIELNSLLVPVDFSETSKSAFAQALELATGENASIILLHVIDTAVSEMMAGAELGSQADIAARLREHAQREIAAYAKPSDKAVDVQTIVCEGVPFFEIIRKADELLVDAIVIGRHGMRGRIEKLLFGTTAERVIRASTRPVIMLPVG